MGMMKLMMTKKSFGWESARVARRQLNIPKSINVLYAKNISIFPRYVAYVNVITFIFKKESRMEFIAQRPSFPVWITRISFVSLAKNTWLSRIYQVFEVL